MFRNAQQQHDHLTRTGSASTRPSRRGIFLYKQGYSYGTAYDSLHIQRHRLKERLGELLDEKDALDDVLKVRMRFSEWQRKSQQREKLIADIKDVQDELSSITGRMKCIRTGQVAEAFMTVARGRLDDVVFDELLQEARRLASGERAVPDIP